MSTEHDLDNFRYQIGTIRTSIEFSIGHLAELPSLILIYSLIDILAWLNRDDARDDVTRSDFIEWCNNFLLPDYDCEASAVDLYSARCAVLHSAIPASRLVREGTARPINYCMGTETVGNFKAEVAPLKHSDYNGVYVKIEELYGALCRGIDRYLIHVAADPATHSRFFERIKKYYLKKFT